MKIDDGVELLGKNRYAIRVKRVDRRTGKVTNRRATVEGSAAAALQRRDELRAELAGGGTRDSHITLRGYAEPWIVRRRAWLKPSTAVRYTFALGHILKALGDLELAAIAPTHVADYVAARGRAGGAGSTVGNELRLLRTIARDAMTDGYSQRYWCERVRTPTPAQYSAERPNLLTALEAGRVLARIPRHWVGLVFLLMTTGLRIGEASALKWDDVSGGVATVQRSNYRGAEGDTKTASSRRTVPVLPAVLAFLGTPRPGKYLFPARGGGMHRGSPLRSVLTRACAEANAKRITAHGLRRTFNDLARRRGSREVLKSITGHVTDAMVNHYSLVDADEKASLAAAVAAAIGEPTTEDA